MNLKAKATKGAAWSLIDQVVNQAGSFALLIYLSRILTPNDFGLIAMLAVFVAISQSLIDSGFSQALIQKSSNVTEDDLSTVFYVNLIISTLLYCLLYFSAPMIAEFYQQPELINLSRALFISIIINAVAIVPRSKLQIAINFKTQSLINTASIVISAIVAIYMVISDYSYWSLVGLTLARSLVNSTLLLIFSKWIPKWLFSRDSFQRLFSFGSNLLIAGVIATTIQNLYTVLIGRFFNPTQVGYFQQGHNYTNILSATLSSVTQGVSYPIMTSIQENQTRLVQVYIRVMGVITLITFPIFIGFSAVAEEFVILFLGEKWKPIIPIIVILSFARLITPISGLNLNILNAKGRSDLFLKTDLSKLPMTIIAIVISVPYGIVGMAIAQLCTTFISFFINSYYPGKLFGFGAKEQLKQILPIAASSLIMYLSIHFISIDNMALQMITKIIVGACVYVSMCWILKIPAFIDILHIVFSRISAKQ